jgi:hypothetical protein
MGLRAGHHGFSTGARAFTLAAIVVASLGQFASLAHEVTVRHFRCAEHGELTHVGAAAGEVAASPRDALRSQTAAAIDAHEHCGVAFMVEGSAAGPSTSVAGRLPPPPPVPAPPAPRLHARRAVALAAAPKNSPPRA